MTLNQQNQQSNARVSQTLEARRLPVVNGDGPPPPPPPPTEGQFATELPPELTNLPSFAELQRSAREVISDLNLRGIEQDRASKLVLLAIHKLVSVPAPQRREYPFL